MCYHSKINVNNWKVDYLKNIRALLVSSKDCTDKCIDCEIKDFCKVLSGWEKEQIKRIDLRIKEIENGG